MLLPEMLDTVMDSPSTPMSDKKRSERTRLFWISWHQPTDDFRPLTDPPVEPVLGWWCSGYDSEDVPILCAAVSGRNEQQAKRNVRKSWPEADQWRFCEEKAKDWRPGDRFPIEKGWEKDRFAKAEAE